MSMREKADEMSSNLQPERYEKSHPLHDIEIHTCMKQLAEVKNEHRFVVISWPTFSHSSMSDLRIRNQ